LDFVVYGFTGIKIPKFVPLSQRGAHILCRYGHQNVMPIFMAGCPYSL